MGHFTYTGFWQIVGRALHSIYGIFEINQSDYSIMPYQIVWNNIINNPNLFVEYVEAPIKIMYLFTRAIHCLLSDWCCNLPIYRMLCVIASPRIMHGYIVTRQQTAAYEISKAAIKRGCIGGQKAIHVYPIVLFI